jgi:hypothetical protein
MSVGVGERRGSVGDICVSLMSPEQLARWTAIRLHFLKLVEQRRCRDEVEFLDASTHGRGRRRVELLASFDKNQLV